MEIRFSGVVAVAGLSILTMAGVASPANAATRPTFEVTVAGSKVLSVGPRSARVQLRLRLGFVNCRGRFTTQSTLFFPRNTEVKVYLTDSLNLRARRGRPNNASVRRIGRSVHRFVFREQKCQPSIVTPPHLLWKYYTRTITLRNLTPRRTYYLAPCLSGAQVRSRSASARTRCASVVKFSTGVNWQAPDVQFAGIIAPGACRPGRTPIRLKLKNAGLGPVTRPFDVWFSWRPVGSSTRAFQTRRLTIRSRIPPGQVVTRFINITGRGNGEYTANLRIDPQARLRALGEASGNNQRRNIRFRINTQCLGGGAAARAYDLAVSNIRFANNRLCKGRIQYVLSNRRQTRTPQLRFNVNIKIWVDGRLRANQNVWYRNLLRGRRAVTLNYSPRVIPQNRPSSIRIRVTYLPGAASADTNAANNVTERTFSCNPNRL